jgi:hypothetical protein
VNVSRVDVLRHLAHAYDAGEAIAEAESNVKAAKHQPKRQRLAL